VGNRNVIESIIQFVWWIFYGNKDLFLQAKADNDRVYWNELTELFEPAQREKQQ